MPRMTGQGSTDENGDDRLHPAWCAGGDGPHHEHFSTAVRVDGARALVVEVAMDPEEDEAPHVSILREDDSEAFTVDVAQALQLSRVLEQVARPAA